MGYINNMDITDGKIKAETSPSPDGTVINATLDNLPPEVCKYSGLMSGWYIVITWPWSV